MALARFSVYSRFSKLLTSHFEATGNWHSRATSVTVASAKAIIDTELDGIQKAGTWKSERIITSPQGSSITVQGSSKTILNFCANNYLGLSSHPAVVEAGLKALKTHGAGLSSVRFICGTQDIHKELEEKVSKFHGREDAILYSSCFDANAGVFEVLLNSDDAILSDELNHASIIDGIRLCKAQRYRYKHKDMADLEQMLKESQGCRQRLVTTDGVFSMDGNITPLRTICDLADKYKAIVLMDEAHATGFFGKTGRGTEEYWGVEGRVDVINSTLGKALGGASGGYTTGPKFVIDLLRQRSRPYLFSNALPPPVVACASKLWQNTQNPLATSSPSAVPRSSTSRPTYLNGNLEAIEIYKHQPTMNRGEGYRIPAIYQSMLSRDSTRTDQSCQRPSVSAEEVTEMVMKATLKQFLHPVEVFDLLMESSELIEKVATNTTRFRTRMADAGFDVRGDPEHPICPVMLGDAKLATEFSDKMLESGIYVIGFSFPVVPKGQARIRVQLSAAHSIEDVDKAVDAFISIGRKLAVIK